jgi:hypothetical protein
LEGNTADKTVARVLAQEKQCDAETAALHLALRRAYARAVENQTELRRLCEPGPADEATQARYERTAAIVGRLAVAIGNCQAITLQESPHAS